MPLRSCITVFGGCGLLESKESVNAKQQSPASPGFFVSECRAREVRKMNANLRRSIKVRTPHARAAGKSPLSYLVIRNRKTGQETKKQHRKIIVFSSR